MKDWTFGMLILIACLALTGVLFYMESNSISPQQMCMKKCAKANKSGSLVYQGPYTPKSKSYDMDRDCECS